jgi:NADPH:quinone reductase
MSPAVPTHQRALEVVEISKPLQLSQQRPVPAPSKSQILVKVLVVGLNPHDAKSRSAGLFLTPPFAATSPLPAVLGNDVVGRVVSIGDAVKGTQLTIGDIVVSHADLRHVAAGPSTSLQHGLQEYAVADPACTAKVPSGLAGGLDAMATVPTNAIAGVFALFAPPRSGPNRTGGLGIPVPWMKDVSPEWERKVDAFDYGRTTVLVVGGGSNCGRWAVQLLRLAGIGKIVVVGGKEEELKDYGATKVIDRHGGDEAVLARVKEAVGDDLLYAFDAVNVPADQLVAVRALSTKHRGSFSRLVRNPHVDLEAAVTENEIGFNVVDVLGGSQVNPEIAAPFWARLEGWMKTGVLKATPYERVYIKKNWSDAESKVNGLLDWYDIGAKVTRTHFHISE